MSRAIIVCGAHRFITPLLVCSFIHSSLQPPGLRGDPLIIVDTPVEAASGQGWVQYVKGAARACTIVHIACVAQQKRIDLQMVAPQLYHSMLAIAVRRLVCDGRQGIALKNAQLSARGAIRKTHDLATWMAKLMILQKDGLDPSAVLKTWNEISTQDWQSNNVLIYVV